jgi:hypothetical protein
MDSDIEKHQRHKSKENARLLNTHTTSPALPVHPCPHSTSLNLHSRTGFLLGLLLRPSSVLEHLGTFFVCVCVCVL